ncbi:hypothetical protein GOP47_0026095 [Adiantum capillus-veneris]|uniref:Glycosyltransferase n=1 Tax=Adiantum capillus-veneris TaxID=13818 RepID=A0A9D4U412_ADICA|nr:hypothetical protein GOP47_0026095 [Adiantum capillus-veneris]
MAKEQQHALAVPLPGQGHINPMMRLCRILAKKGVTVTFVNIDPIHKRMKELRQQQQEEEEQPIYASQEELVGEIRRARVPMDGLDLGQIVSMEAFFEALKKGLGPHLHQLVLRLNREGSRVTCLLSDMLLTATTQFVADAFNIPRIALYSSSQSTLLFHHHLMTDPVVSTEHAMEVARGQPRPDVVFAEGLAGLPPLIHARDLPHFRHHGDDNLYMFRFMEREMLLCYQTAHCVVVNSFDALERPAFDALSSRVNPPLYGVGPLVDSLEEKSTTSFWKEDEACILWLDQQAPLSVLYISFGSVTCLSYPQFEEIVHGLLSSQHCFLWVVRPGLLPSPPNGEKRSLDLFSASHGRGRIVDWAPQLRVLAHPSIGGFLTHCGWNSTIEAIHHGVPMLCWPYFSDQYFNAKFVEEEWRIGLRFNMTNECKMIERFEIERVIKVIMEGHEGKVLRQNAQKFKEASNNAILPEGSSCKNIQALLDSLHI